MTIAYRFPHTRSCRGKNCRGSSQGMIGKNYSRSKSGWSFCQLRQECSVRRYRSAPSLCCGPRSRTRKPTLNEVLVGQAQRQEAIVSTSIPGLSLLPSDLDPAGAEAELPKVDNWQQGLSRVLISLDSVCDAAIIDTPPGWRTPLQRIECCYGSDCDLSSRGSSLGDVSDYELWSNPKKR